MRLKAVSLLLAACLLLPTATKAAGTTQKVLAGARRFEIVFMISLPFTAIFSILEVGAFSFLSGKNAGFSLNDTQALQAAIMAVSASALIAADGIRDDPRFAQGSADSRNRENTVYMPVLTLKY